ncbi:MAG: thioredoxin [Lachnospiraceae bacterium]|nr:thioredoxin [Lachnospiraceae bacterium]
MRRFLGSPRIGFLAAAFGAVLMAVGIFRGEMPVVLGKAINICMECIGIG